MKAMSPQRRADEARRKKGYAAVAERAAGRCELGISPACSGRHECTHHRLPRSATSVRNADRHAPDLLLALCHCCHRAVHAAPERSYAAGHLIRRSA